MQHLVILPYTTYYLTNTPLSQLLYDGLYISPRLTFRHGMVSRGYQFWGAKRFSVGGYFSTEAPRVRVIPRIAERKITLHCPPRFRCALSPMLSGTDQTHRERIGFIVHALRSVIIWRRTEYGVPVCTYIPLLSGRFCHATAWPFDGEPSMDRNFHLDDFVELEIPGLEIKREDHTNI